MGVVSFSLPLPPTPVPEEEAVLHWGAFRKKENQYEPISLGPRRAREVLVLTIPSASGYSCRPEDEAYDEDGNPLQDFYDSDPPGVGSPASALRDAYALYYPVETRY